MEKPAFFLPAFFLLAFFAACFFCIVAVQAEENASRPQLLGATLPAIRHLPSLPSWGGDASRTGTSEPVAGEAGWHSANLPGFGDSPSDYSASISVVKGTGLNGAGGNTGTGLNGIEPAGLTLPFHSGSIGADGRQKIADLRQETAVFFPGRTIHDSIVISARCGHMRTLRNSDVYFLEGDCSIRQGEDVAHGPMAVVWVDHPQAKRAPRRVLIYLESDDAQSPVEIRLAQGSGASHIRDWSWNGEFFTTATVDRFIPDMRPPQTDFPEIYGRALDSLTPKNRAIVQTQYRIETPGSSLSSVTGGGARKIGLYSRSDLKTDVQGGPDPNNPGRSVYVISNGINLTIEGVNNLSPMLQGRVQDISADHAVIWADNIGVLQGGEQNVQKEEDDFEVFLAGNIVFRDGPRTIFADRLYYDVKNKLAYIVDGEVLAPIPNMRGAGLSLSGVARMKAEILRQQGDGMFEAENAMITTSLLGKPSYKLRAKTMTLNEISTPLSHPLTGEPRIDANTGRQASDDKLWLVSENNFIEFGDVPVFYWPWMATDVRDPILYIKSIGYGSDTIFGNQYRTAWNPYQILGIRNRPEGTSWDLNLDYYDKRGFGHGTDFSYNRDNFFGIPGKTQGKIEFWGIQDSGLDFLSRYRRNLDFPESYRYRLNYKHRQELGTGPDPWILSARIGKTSDRNFIEQYYENTWYTSENETTALELRKAEANRVLSVSAEYSLNYFVTNTNALPRLDYYILGQSLLRDLLTWHSHTRLQYAQYTVTDAPDTAQELRYFRYLPQELDTDGNPIFAEGEAFSTRHELDLPFSLGPVRCVPYVLGDFSHWGKDRTGESLQRWYGQVGARFNLPFWKVFPNVSSRAFYVNGLAHKIDFDAEYLYASSDQPLDRLIMYDPLDDWSTDASRRMYATTTHANLDSTIAPHLYDARYYALRSAFAGNVTASSMEIADSLTLLRVGMTHRWQTKRGSARKRNIIDWITLSTHFNYYPETEQNHGESIGLIDYDFKWHVGDRLSIFSAGLFDTMAGGQSIVSLGGMLARPGRGSVSVITDWLDGPLQYTYLTLNTAYVMNEKYSMSYSTSYDLTHNQNVGHSFTFIRSGESFRLMVGANYNESRDNWSFSVGIEPSFLSGLNRLTQRTTDQWNRR